MEVTTKVVDSGEQKELENVLKQYLELLSYDCNRFKYFMAPNATVDWFGRSVRGPAKIHDYLRYYVCNNYEHINFNDANHCNPIETKMDHRKTKVRPYQDVNLVHWSNRVAGTTSLKPYADSDIDDDDVEMQVTSSGTTEKTEKTNTNIAEESGQHSQEALDSDDDGVGVKAKRIKLSQPKHFTYLRRLPSDTVIDSRKYKNTFESSSEDEDEASSTSKRTATANYTRLFYLQTEGVLRMRQKPKYPGQIASRPNFFFRDGKNSCNECAIRIRFSYRKNLIDQQLEFALIIYELLDESAVKPIRRRNLMSEFSQVANDELADSSDAEDEELAIIDEQPAIVVNAEEETVVATVETPTTAEIAAALEAAAFTIVPLRTPTKHTYSPPGTPKRKPRSSRKSLGLKRLNMSPSTSTSQGGRSNAARCLRL